LTFGVAVIVFAAIFGGWYEALWKPTNQRISSLNASIASSRTSLSQAIAELAVLKGEKAHLGQLKSEVATLRAALPTTTDLQGFYAAVNQAASGAGLPLINIAPTKPSVAATTPVMTPSTSATSASASGAVAAPGLSFSLQTEGGYYQIESLLLALDALPRLVSISGVTLSTVGASAPGYPASDGVILNATITGVAYQSASA
jgi:Tfp pilus assembly protein PilO